MQHVQEEEMGQLLETSFVNVPDHLSPASGISSAKIRLRTLEVAGANPSEFNFEIFNDDALVGVFAIQVTAGPDENIDQTALVAYSAMNDALRQMLFQNEEMRKAYEKNVNAR